MHWVMEPLTDALFIVYQVLSELLLGIFVNLEIVVLIFFKILFKWNVVTQVYVEVNVHKTAYFSEKVAVTADRACS